MIALAQNCLVFELASGEKIPFSADMISVELLGDASTVFDPEFVRNAASSVFHYFRHDLRRETVTMAEFAEALEKVLRGFGCAAFSAKAQKSDSDSTAADLSVLAGESARGCELMFFPLLRKALQTQMNQSPQLIHFRGLRGCVKQLTGARRWSVRCDNLRDQIVEYLRHCVRTENEKADCLLVVE